MEKGIYFKLHLKKALKLYPAIFLITVITLSSIALTCVLLLKANNGKETKQKVSIGIVGDINDTYLGIGVHALKNIDSSRFSIDFMEMDEKDAVNKLKKREIKGYVYIPQNFVQGIYSGKNIPAKFVTLNSPDGFGAIVMSEIAEVVSDIVTESQNGIYSMQSVAHDSGKKTVVQEKTEKLNLSYIECILGRNESYQHKILGVLDSLSMGGYYVCSVVFFFLLIWGISCNSLLGSGNLSLYRMLKISGVKVWRQMLYEYAVYLIITVFTLCVFAVVTGIVLQNTDIGIKEINGAGVFECLAFVAANIPVIIMITLMHMMMYEIVTGTVSRILIQFLIAVGLGYISGCLYPNYFFPDKIQKLAEFFPSGVGFAYIRRVMSETLSFIDILQNSLYSVFFASVTLIFRYKRIAGEKQ